ncbi:head-tail connector protein [Clostridium celatum]|uniref:head-tail connector protein n=1 Tax=Clostridium celatum TaxID=36834 RepID=UPI002910D717|nr:head-tail connector protein [Clostridium celatum]MDU6296820.1 head-tail connector protein [Clostridium celatum]
MKISEVTINDLKEYASVDHNYDDKMFQDILMAAKSYIKSYTGLNEEQIDNKEDLTIALMVLCNEMYDNRVFSVQDNKANTVITNILDMYAVNLL